MDEYASARGMMHGSPLAGPVSGESPCASCGMGTGQVPMRKAVSNTFTDWDALRRFPGNLVCDGCAGLLGDPLNRRESRLWLPGQPPRKMERGEAWAILTDPPPLFALSWAASRQRHAWLRCGLSTPKRMIVGTDARSVVHIPARDDEALREVQWLLESGVGPVAIETGRYPRTVVLALGQERLGAAERLLSPRRPGGLIALYLWAFPKELRGTLQPSSPMIPPQDDIAADIIAKLSLASHSRTSDGLRYWGSLLERRIRRAQGIPLADRVARLMAQMDMDPLRSRPALDLIRELDAETEAAVCESLDKRTRLVIALAFDKVQGEKELRKAPRSPRVEADAPTLEGTLDFA